MYSFSKKIGDFLNLALLLIFLERFTLEINGAESSINLLQGAVKFKNNKKNNWALCPLACRLRMQGTCCC